MKIVEIAPVLKRIVIPIPPDLWNDYAEKEIPIDEFLTSDGIVVRMGIDPDTETFYIAKPRKVRPDELLRRK